MRIVLLLAPFSLPRDPPRSVPLPPSDRPVPPSFLFGSDCGGNARRWCLSGIPGVGWSVPAHGSGAVRVAVPRCHLLQDWSALPVRESRSTFRSDRLGSLVRTPGSTGRSWLPCSSSSLLRGTFPTGGYPFHVPDSHRVSVRRDRGNRGNRPVGLPECRRPARRLSGHPMPQCADGRFRSARGCWLHARCVHPGDPRHRQCRHDRSGRSPAVPPRPRSGPRVTIRPAS